MRRCFWQAEKRKSKKRKRGHKKRRPIEHHKFTIGSDCSGCEGIVNVVQHILGNKKVDHAFSCDREPSVKRYIMQNHNPAVWFDDMTKRGDDEPPKVQCYSAGFPCQPFSIAGKKKGTKDKRGKILFHVARLIKKNRPPIVILENVKGFMFSAFAAIREWLLEFLRTCGYKTHVRILNSKECGIPQNRPRCYIVALQEKKSRSRSAGRKNKSQKAEGILGRDRLRRSQALAVAPRRPEKVEAIVQKNPCNRRRPGYRGMDLRHQSRHQFHQVYETSLSVHYEDERCIELLVQQRRPISFPFRIVPVAGAARRGYPRHGWDIQDH